MPWNHHAQSNLSELLAGSGLPSAVAGLVDRDGNRLVVPWHSNGGDDTVYDVASITKSIPTSCLALTLIHEHVFRPETKLTDLLPEYRGDAHATLTVGDLLSFRVPFALTLSRLKNLSADELLDRILHAPINGELGGSTPPAYVNTTSILLGMAVSRASGRDLAPLARDTFFAPLQMHHTTFQPDPAWPIEPTEKDPWRGYEVRGEVHDESAWKLREIFTPGSAGLFSTVPDLLTFLHWLLQPEQAYLRPTGQGWEWHEPWMGLFATQTTFGKTGFTGCCVVADAEKGRAGVLLSNATWPERGGKPDLTRIRKIFSSSLVSYSVDNKLEDLDHTMK